MAPNRQFEQENRASSSEEDEGLSEENEEQEVTDSDEEEEDKTSPATISKQKLPSASKKASTSTVETPAQPQSSSTDDSESGSDSDSGSGDLILQPRKSGHNVKPIASKPMEEAPKAAKKPRSKTSAPVSVTPVKSRTAGKRPNGSDTNRDEKESKKAKKKASSDGANGEETPKKALDDPKKQLFQRLWSEEDEIAILKGLTEYTAKKGADALSDMNAFYEYVKDKLHVDVSKNQLADKVRRLKKKFKNNASRGNKGKEPIFSKAHEQKAYELSKKVWTAEGNSLGFETPKANGTAVKNNKAKSSELPKVEVFSSPDRKEATRMEVERISAAPSSTRFGKSIGDSCLEDEILKDGIELIKGAKRIELEEKWKQLRVEEVEVYLKRVELISEQTKLVLEALKSSTK